MSINTCMSAGREETQDVPVEGHGSELGIRRVRKVAGEEASSG